MGIRINLSRICCSIMLGLSLLGLSPVLAHAVEFDAEYQSAISQQSRILLMSAMNYQEDFGEDVANADFTKAQIQTGIKGYRVIDGEISGLGIDLWPLVENEKIIAVIQALYIDGDITNSGFNFGTQYVNALTELSKDNTSLVYLVDGNQDGYIVGNATWGLLDKSGGVVTKKPLSEAPDWITQFVAHNSELMTETNVVYLDCSQMDFTPSNEAVTENRTRVSRSTSSYVAPVISASMNFYVPPTNQRGEDQSDDEQYGICWASASASAGDYLTNSSYNGWQVAKWVGKEGQGGTSEDMLSALRYFTYSNGTSLNPEYIRSAIIDSSMKNWICNGMPLIADLNPTNGKYGHSVVIHGYDTSNGSLVLKVMNPGTDISTGLSKYQIMTRFTSNTAFMLNYANDVFRWNKGTICFVGWEKPFGKSSWSYFDSAGRKATGWHSLGGAWYYFDKYGTMKTGWVSDDGYWYYLDPSHGAMKTGWIFDSGSWYFMNSSGQMQTGWINDDKEWFYCNSSGVMQTGWLEKSGSWYYLRPSANTPISGSMGAAIQDKSAYIDGKTYHFNYSGVCTNP